MTTRSQQLRSSFLLIGIAAAVALAIGMAVVGGQDARHKLERQANARGEEVGVRVAALVSSYLNERRHEIERLALSPAIAAALRAPAHRGPPGDPILNAYFRAYTAHAEISGLVLTDGRGLGVASSGTLSPTYAGEEWWQEARRDGVFESEAARDSAGAVRTEYAVLVRAGKDVLGVLRGSIDLESLARTASQGDLGELAYIQVVDPMGRVVVAPDSKSLLTPLPEGQAIPRQDRALETTVQTSSGPELVVTVPANDGKWWALFRQPESRAYAAVRTTERMIWLGAAAFLCVTVLLVWRLAIWLDRRVTAPVRAAGAVASRVAGGDLSVTISTGESGTSEVGDLLASVHTMVVALRRLVGAIRSAADEAAAMAAEISASTEEMSASTEEMSATCQDLSRRAADQAQLIRAAADDAGKILQIITILAAGAEDSVRRNTSLATLARQNKDVLDQSTAQLTALADDVARGAAEADALAAASAEIQKFVTQAKSVATQTNMLALNAAIEAARAGPQGRGFAVVADEVRKLASVAANAAGETADTVRGVLNRVQATRDRLAALAKGGAAARQAAETAAQGLATVAAEAQANDAWSREIARSTSDVRTLVEEITSRLGSVAQGTEGLLASTEEIAASSEEQSASTQEVAASANQLAEAADKLSGAVKTFRLLADDRGAAREAAD